MASTERSRVLYAVGLEREAQVRKWGEQHHPDIANAEIADHWRQMAERYKVINDGAARRESGTNWTNILLEEVFEALAEAASDPASLEAELVQVCAVACAWIEDIRSRRGLS